MYSVVFWFVFLFSVLNRVVSATSDGPTTEEEGKYEALVKWTQKLGGHLIGCSIQNTPYAGMGMFADIDLKKRTVVSRTPLAAIITSKNHLLPDNFSSALEVEDLNNALFLAHERRRGDSFWQPYLDSLPKDLGVLSFTENDIKELDGSEVAQLVKKMQDELNTAIEQTFEDLRMKPILNLTHLTREDVMWGYSMWKSRDFEGRQKGTTMLVPVADMFNVAMGAKASNVKCGDGRIGKGKNSSYAMVCSLTKDVTAGEELLLDYSYDPNYRFNAKLLVEYGFVVRDNPYDSVTVKAPYLSNDWPHYRVRSQMAKEFFPDIIKYRKHYYMYQLSKPQDGPDDELVSFMRLKYGTFSEISTAAELEEPFSQPLSAKSEQRAWKRTLEFLLDVQQKYTTNIEEDEEILLQNGLSENSRKAVVLRLEEKIILEDYIKYVRNHLEELSKDSLLKGEL